MGWLHLDGIPNKFLTRICFVGDTWGTFFFNSARLYYFGIWMNESVWLC